jgi:WhiB family transcriptional regulator, redox-sensing transcriptional regulator
MDLSRYHGTRIERPSPGEMAQMVADGDTLHHIAALFGCSPGTLRRELVSAGYSSTTGRPLGRAEAEVAELVAAVPPPGPWVADALCAQVDTELFFPPKGGSTYEAKAVCARCPVAADCLDYALSLPQQVDYYGIWGGTSERERRRLRAGQTLPERTKTCPGCGEEFVVYHAKRAYCSKTCQNRAHQRRQTQAREGRHTRRTA